MTHHYTTSEQWAESLVKAHKRIEHLIDGEREKSDLLVKFERQHMELVDACNKALDALEDCAYWRNTTVRPYSVKMARLLLTAKP